mmetsp:Transcript_10366/g.32925  ORF Transcript_10366/g.32925 Transcript_10366/m.32925 type:complete len:417 (-) Transcript_10366:216-1466(-)
MYLYGGVNSTGEVSDIVYAVDISTPSTWYWTGVTVSDPALLGRRKGHCHILRSPTNSLVMFGNDGSDFRSDVVNFNFLTASAPEVTAFTAPGDVPGPRAYAACAMSPIQNYIYVFGGRGDAGVLNDLYKLDFSANLWIKPNFTFAGSLTSLPMNFAASAVFIKEADVFSFVAFGGVDAIQVVKSDAIRVDDTGLAHADCNNYASDILLSSLPQFANCTAENAWFESDESVRHSALCTCISDVLADLDSYLSIYSGCPDALRTRTRFQAYADRGGCSSTPNSCLMLYTGSEVLSTACGGSDPFCDCVLTERAALGVLSTWAPGNFTAYGCIADDIAYVDSFFAGCDLSSSGTGTGTGNEPVGSSGTCLISGADAVTSCQASRPPAMAFTCAEDQLPALHCPDGQLFDGTSCIDVCLQ